jgi:Ca2+-binding EF-hand superfamily protein
VSWVRVRPGDADKDGNGTLDVQEFSTLYTTLQETELCSREQDVAAVLDELDRDNDEQVVFGEFIGWLLDRGQFEQLSTKGLRRATKISELQTERRDEWDEGTTGEAAATQLEKKIGAYIADIA